MVGLISCNFDHDKNSPYSKYSCFRLFAVEGKCLLCTSATHDKYMWLAVSSCKPQSQLVTMWINATSETSLRKAVVCGDGPEWQTWCHWSAQSWSLYQPNHYYTYYTIPLMCIELALCILIYVIMYMENTQVQPIHTDFLTFLCKSCQQLENIYQLQISLKMSKKKTK